jgi:hypothetical protein
VYIDAGSPPAVARDLGRIARRHDVLLLRTDAYLSPNEARNLAAPFATTEFVAFTDNDLLFPRGWLERLVGCAVHTGAWLVSPVIVQQGRHGVMTHMVGGDCGIDEERGRRRFHEDHGALGRALDDRKALTRQRTGFVEFHCVLVARSALDVCFPLDEALLSARDHCDLTLQTTAAGGQIWLEPSVTITQMELPDRLPAHDRRYYMLRWSDAWNRASLARFREKWDLDPEDPLEAHDLRWLSVHRLYGNRAYGGPAGELPSKPLRAGIRFADRCVQTMLKLRRSTLRRPVLMPSVEHAPAWTSGVEQVVRG